MLSSAPAECGDVGQIKKQAIIVNSSLFICIYLAGQGSKVNVERCKLMPRFRPAHAALLEAETREQASHADRRADGLDDRNAELILEPVRFDVHGTLADAHWDNHLGASLD